MRQIFYIALGLTTILTACERGEYAATGSKKDQGRYSGIGTFEAGRLWSQIKRPVTGTDDKARLDDDEHVIVVVDTHSGEIRQCGDHSGFCVKMNPWSNDSAVPATPVSLEKHAAQLDAEAAEQFEPEKVGN